MISKPMGGARRSIERAKFRMYKGNKSSRPIGRGVNSVPFPAPRCCAQRNCLEGRRPRSRLPRRWYRNSTLIPADYRTAFHPNLRQQHSRKDRRRSRWDAGPRGNGKGASHVVGTFSVSRRNAVRTLGMAGVLFL